MSAKRVHVVLYINKSRRTSVRVHSTRGPDAERVVLVSVSVSGAGGGLAVDVRLRRGLAVRERRAPAEREHRVRAMRGDLALHLEERRQLERLAALRRVRLCE